jgi:hypothetical protein
MSPVRTGVAWRAWACRAGHTASGEGEERDSRTVGACEGGVASLVQRAALVVAGDVVRDV